MAYYIALAIVAIAFTYSMYVWASKNAERAKAERNEREATELLELRANFRAAELERHAQKEAGNKELEEAARIAEANARDAFKAKLAVTGHEVLTLYYKMVKS